MLNRIAAIGPDALIRELESGSAPDSFSCLDHEVWDSVATGDSLWLLVAYRLQGSVDACVGESEAGALSTALAVAPSRVLRLFAGSDPVTLDDACSQNFLFYEGTTTSQVRSYYQRLLPALDAVRDTALRPALERCRANALRTRASLLPQR